MSNAKTTKDLILKTLKEKSSVKQDIYQISVEVFAEMKLVLKEVEVELRTKLKSIDERVIIEYKDRGDFEVELKIAGDTLIFLLHTNIFTFDKSHSIWKTSYVQKDNYNSYCGMISIYNFLSDSFKFNRVNDIGYLIARLFTNKDKHFFVEGKRQFGFLFNDFDHAVIDRKRIREVVDAAILYCLEFDLYTPPYDEVKQVSVLEMIETNNLKLSTGKRLGFRFQTDDENFE